MAMITAILFMMVLTMFAVSAVALSAHSLNTTAVDRKRTQAIGAAEAGIDITLQNVASTPLPCGTSSTLGTGPTQSSYSVTVTYYDGSGTALACTSGSGPAGVPASALLSSTGTTNATVYGNRTMQALVKLTGVSSAFGDAVFANGLLTDSNQTTINGNGANNANVYTNTSYVCGNNEMVYGSVYSQGDISASNTCSAAGDWWAKGSVSATGSNAVGGNVYAAGATSGSTGKITLANTSVAGNAVAKGSISPTPCGPGQKIAGTCSANGSPGVPPYQPFPVLDWNASPWTAAGYAVVDDRGKCTGTTSAFYTDVAAMNTASLPTVFLADCPIDWSKNTWKFNTDVAVWSSGGMSAANQTTFQSASSTPHNFQMIVPYHAFGTTSPVTAPCDISFSNQTTLGPPTNPLNVLIYTPCNITVNNNQTMSGQLFAGNAVTINNRYVLNFKMVIPPGGAVGSPITSYLVALEYEREVVGP